MNIGISQVPSEVIAKVLTAMREESMALVAQPPDTLRTEFGFGRANGIMRAIARFEELLELEVAEYFKLQEKDGDDDGL